MTTPTHQNALPLGSMLMEYRLASVLGAGGFGITYLARDTNLEKDVAIKEYLPGSVAVRAPDPSVRPTNPSLPGRLQVGSGSLHPGIAHARQVRSCEHRAREPLLRGQRHRLHGDGLRGRRAVEGI